MTKLQFILAIALLLCLAPMPYGYYILVRYSSAILFGTMAYQYYLEKKENPALVWGTLAILFQPIIKISLGKTIWNIIDVLVAIILFVIILYSNKKENEPSK